MTRSVVYKTTHLGQILLNENLLVIDRWAELRCQEREPSLILHVDR